MPAPSARSDSNGAAAATWPRRGAAILALLAPIAMAVVAAVALAGDVAIAVLAVALVLGASATMWVALTNRGGVRAVAAVAALLAAGGLVAVLATHWQGVIVLVALLLLLAAFGLAARYALGRTGTAAAERLAARALRATPAGRGVLIINLKSGSGKAERFDLVGEARRRGIEPVVLRPGDDLLALAEDAIAGGADVIGMAGGDGSQALVATVAARRGVPHVCIPAGTRNHFALDLGLDRDDVVGALDAYTEGVERRIDLARVNDRVFVNNASLGVYAKVVQSDAYRDAKLETWARMLPDLLGPDAEPIDLEFTTPDGQSCSDAPLILVSNNPYRLTSLSGAGTREGIDSGELGVVAARVVRASDVSKLVALELAGQAGRFPGLMSWAAEEFEVRSSGPVEVGLDGEALVLEPPLRFVTDAGGPAGATAAAARARAGGARGDAHAARASRRWCEWRRGGEAVDAAAPRSASRHSCSPDGSSGNCGSRSTARAISKRCGNSSRPRTSALTSAARAITWAGSSWVLVPLALICCCGAAPPRAAPRGGRDGAQPRRRDLAVAPRQGPRLAAAPARRAPAARQRLELPVGTRNSGERVLARRCCSRCARRRLHLPLGARRRYSRH